VTIYVSLSEQRIREESGAPKIFNDLQILSEMVKNAHLHHFPHPSSLRRTLKYASFLRISGALHLGVFEQPEE
jgi:hypothetical protein